ncbi:hypothetical protein FRC11_011234 [Ceratobasidium sp. 423]|nr:hypothetical protein FRC11_011234 [Ceratobasidium sp. 423]
MQAYKTQQYKPIKVSAEQYGFVLQQSLHLQQAIVWHQEILEENPSNSLISGGLLETATMDWLALCLQQLICHSPNLEGQVFITFLSRNQALLCDPSRQTAFPWLSSKPPNWMLILIVQPSTVGMAGHYYMYHVVFNDLGSNPLANFYYIDSLGHAPTEAMEQDQDLQALELRPSVAGPSQEALMLKKATSNPFAKKKANSLHSDSTPLLFEQLMVPPKQPGKTNTPIQQPIFTSHTVEPDALLACNHVLDECFNQLSLLSGTAASYQPETGPKSAMQAKLKVQETGLVKAPLH